MKRAGRNVGLETLFFASLFLDILLWLLVLAASRRLVRGRWWRSRLGMQPVGCAGANVSLIFNWRQRAGIAQECVAGLFSRIMKDWIFSTVFYLVMYAMNRDRLDPLATRPSLLNRIRNTADQESWQEFYNLYSGLVHRFALRRGLTEAEAQDVVQDTFICVAKSIEEFRYDPQIGSFRGWLLHTTEWRIWDQRRKRPQEASGASLRAVDPHRTATIDRIPDASIGELQARWEHEWQQTLVETALQCVKSQISAKQFQIFDLYVVKDWPVFKVARALSVSVSQIYLAKHRVRKVIKNKVKEIEASLN